ncbi:hypothetical protein [Hugenholtzia roseola]|uniref:hypothetical protein n=1 Tax=Hugenholtzia roseola TaxID=1002 RepID=UPI00040A23FE|nr:hypothetical protein [Hugenholtzia roseola]
MKKLLIITEAGKGIGLGHYTRCSAIQQEALKNKIDALMLLYLRENSEFSIKGEVFNWLENIEKIKEYASYGYVLVDSYLATSLHFDFLNQHFKKVFVIDDYNRIEYRADLIINPNVFFQKKSYKNQNVIGGKELVILRESFKRENPIKPKENMNRLLITIGGSDFRNLLPTLLEVALQTTIPEIFIIDPEAKLFSKDLPKRVHLLAKQTEQEMFDNYQKADIVISACGQTLHELASMSKPTVGICLDIDQEPNQVYYFNQSFLLKKIEWNNTDLSEKILQNISFLEPFYVRNLIYHYAPTLVSKKGTERLLTLLIKNA